VPRWMRRRCLAFLLGPSTHQWSRAHIFAHFEPFGQHAPATLPYCCVLHPICHCLASKYSLLQQGGQLLCAAGRAMHITIARHVQVQGMAAAFRPLGQERTAGAASLGMRATSSLSNVSCKYMAVLSPAPAKHALCRAHSQPAVEAPWCSGHSQLVLLMLLFPLHSALLPASAKPSPTAPLLRRSLYISMPFLV
jgi:hypothetical protein